MFCCNRLQTSTADPGHAGFGVLVSRAPEYFIFYLQFRAVPSSDEATVRQARIEVPVKIAAAVVIAYCPWCGRRLHDLAKRAPGGFAELARRHEPFLVDP